MSLRRSEIPVLVAVFLDLLGFGMVIADIQLRAEAMVPAGWRPGWIVGVLLASTFVTQLVASPLWGRISDQSGRKRVIVVCTLLSASSMILYGLANSLWLILVSRILSGLGAANVAVVQAHVSDGTEPNQRSVALGRIGAATSAGLVLGPPLGGFLAVAGGNHLIGFAAGSASLLGVIWLAATLPNTKPNATQREEKRHWVDLRLVLDFPELRRFLFIAVVAWFSLATLEGTFARLISHLYHYNQKHFGLIFGYESLLGILTQASLIALVLKRFSDAAVLRVGYLGQGLGLAMNPYALTILPTTQPFAVLIIASTFYAVGSSFANPTINGICSRLTPSDRQGELFGLLQGTRSIGFVLGPVLGGMLFDWQPAAPYALAGGVCILAALMVPSVKVPSPT